MEQDVEKRVGWAELFFDLVFVLAITEISALLRHDPSWAGAGRALVVFIPIYWAWVGTSVLANLRDIDNTTDRLGIFAVGLGGLFMALAVPEAFGARGLLFGLSYGWVRVCLAVLVFRDRPLQLNPFSVAVFISGPLLLAGGLLDGTARIAMWALAGAVDLATPTFLRRRLAALPIAADHLTERFGLFLIIALGESIVSIGAPAAAVAPDLDTSAAVAAAFALACGLWWVYFVFAASAMRFALQTAQVRSTLVRHVLSYGHLGLVGGIIAAAVGMQNAVSHPREHLDPGVVALLYGGTAVYLATFGYTRWRMFRQVSTTRLGAAAIFLALLPAASRGPAVVALAAAAVLVACLNLLEHELVRRGRRHSGEGHSAGGGAERAGGGAGEG